MYTVHVLPGPSAIAWSSVIYFEMKQSFSRPRYFNGKYPIPKRNREPPVLLSAELGAWVTEYASPYSLSSMSRTITQGGGCPFVRGRAGGIRRLALIVHDLFIPLVFEPGFTDSSPVGIDCCGGYRDRIIIGYRVICGVGCHRQFARDVDVCAVIADNCIVYADLVADTNITITDGLQSAVFHSDILSDGKRAFNNRRLIVEVNGERIIRS